MPASIKQRPVLVAIIGAAAVIIAAFLSYKGAIGGFSDPTFDYTGIVRSPTHAPISDAKISITEDQKVPQHIRTDSEGVFHTRLMKKTQIVYLDVQADGYRAYDIFVQPSRTGAEEILLTPDISGLSAGSAAAAQSFHKPPKIALPPKNGDEEKQTAHIAKDKSEQADAKMTKAAIPLASKQPPFIGEKLEECEQPVPNPSHVGFCGTLTWNGEKYDAFWPNVQITATFTIEVDKDNSVTLNRVDISGSPAVTGVYHGTVSQNGNVSGAATWLSYGKPLGSGTWTAKPISP